ncbi:MAG: glycosyltransferase family 4 protein [Candidatus Omnitrophota bacterium]
MKIVCICYEDIAGYAGSNRQVIELVKGLQEIGHQVKLTVPLIRRLNESAGLDIEYIPVINLPFLRYLSYLIISPFYLVKIMFKFKPDAVFVFQIYFDIGSLLACKFLRLPLAFYANGIASDDLSQSNIPKFIVYIVELAQKIYIKYSNKIFAITDFVKEYLREKYSIPTQKLEVLKDAVNIEYFKPMDRDAARGILGLGRDTNLVGFLGSLYPWHGVDYLIDSMPLVLKEVPNTKFIIVGDGPMAKALINQTKKSGLEGKIIFIGSVPFDQAPVYINAFDICIVFFKEVRKNAGDSIKLYEYLACNKPIVTSKRDGYGDVVERIGSGIAVDASNPYETSQAILHLLNNAELRAQMGSKGRAAIIKEHTWLNRARLIEGSLRGIINS